MFRPYDRRMPLPSSLQPLRHRDFAIVWTTGMVSNAGSWMQTVAVGAFVTSETGKAGWAGLAAAAAFLPIGLLAPVGGALRLPFNQAMTLDMVEREEFLAAASLGSAQYNFGRVIGPSLAGAVIALW